MRYPIYYVPDLKNGKGPDLRCFETQQRHMQTYVF